MQIQCGCDVDALSGVDESGGVKKETETMKLNKLKQLFAEERAVSPVVGVALLIAITVILAAVIGGVVLGIGPTGVDAPQAQLNAEFSSTDDTNVTISHNGGDELSGEVVVLNQSGDQIGNVSGLSAGKSKTISDDSNVTKVTVVWQDPNSNSESVIAEFEE